MLPWPFRKKARQLGCVDSGNKLQRQKKVFWRQLQGVSPGRATTARFSPGCKSRGDPRSLGEIKQKYTFEERRSGQMRERDTERERERETERERKSTLVCAGSFFLGFLPVF